MDVADGLAFLLFVQRKPWELISMRSCLLVAALIGFASPALADEQRPNVVLIMTDDQGYGDLGLHGNPHLATPNIDALGQTGIRFERFYVNSFCAPTRAALLTGRYPLRCGVWGVTHNKEAMRPDEVTIPEALRTAGYRTACIGKWHNGEQFPYTPPGQGFDEFFGFHNGHINNYFDTQLLRGATPASTSGYISDVLTDEAIRFVRDSRQRPFFCYLSFNAPHSPYQVPNRYYDKFRSKGLDEAVSAFYGMCENIDDNVGRLLGKLDELGLAENTIVLFLTDNGGTAGVKLYNAGMRGGKTSVHEGGCRVPLFIRWPAQFRQPRVVPQIASHIDLYPTLLDLCGVAPPAGPKLDGISLRPLLEGRDADWPTRVLFTHNPISQTNRYPGAVRTERFRLVREIRGPQGGSSARPNDASAARWQLYDMRSDPGEKKDLAERQPAVVAQLSQLYEDWFDDTASGGLERFPIPVGHDEENPVTLNAPQAYFDGSLRFYRGPGFAHDWLTGWTDAKSKVWFDIDVVRGGAYEVALRYACPESDAGSTIRIRAGNAALTATVPAAEATVVPLHHRDQRSQQRYIDRRWGTWQIGRMSLMPGRQQLKIQVDQLAAEQALELKAVVLTRVNDQPPPRDILAKDNLVAWCIVPFDAKQRSPAERAKMLVRLGIKKVAYDWRANHVPTFEQEILEYKKHGLEYFAFWSQHERAFELFEKYGLHPQIWQTNPSPPGATQEQKVQAAALQLLPLVERSRRMGCQLGLYNHGGWGGEPNNLVAVCQWLQDHHDAQNVGIVYNFHHGHDHIADFAEALKRMQPHLLCLNLNGMNDDAKPKILPIGRGQHEKQMLRIVIDSGYDGAIGILDHRNELDAEESLRANLRGLEKLRNELRVVTKR